MKRGELKKILHEKIKELSHCSHVGNQHAQDVAQGYQDMLSALYAGKSILEVKAIAEFNGIAFKLSECAS